MNKIKMYYNNQINKMGKKQKTIFYTASIILILLVLLCIGGLTYSWFSSIITGNDTAQSNVVETGTLSIVYTNGQELRGESIEPGWSSSKTFTVENTGTVEATYNINWENLTNTFVNKEDLVMSLKSTNNGGTLTETQIRGSGSHINIIKNIKIEPGVIQEYTLTIEYKNKEYDQSSDMGKSLIGKIEVRDANEEIVLPKIMNGIKILDKVHYPQEEQNFSVKKIIIENSINIDKSNELNEGERQATPIDISENQDGSVLLISIYNPETESEIVYLQGEGGIKLNENSSYLYAGLYNVEIIEGLEYLDTSEVKDMSFMFWGLGIGLGDDSKIVLDLTSFDVENVVDTNSMFFQAGLNTPIEINMSNLNFSNLNSAANMFAETGQNNSFKINVENLKMPNVKNMSGMFMSGINYEKGLREIIGDFILPENASLSGFANCNTALKATFVLPNVISNYDDMFKNTSTNLSFNPEITLVTNENNLALANELISLYGPNGTISKGNIRIK